jgi:hypothetical protein
MVRVLQGAIANSMAPCHPSPLSAPRPDLLGDADWALSGTESGSAGGQVDKAQAPSNAEPTELQALQETGATGLEPATSGVTGGHYACK